MFGPYGSRSKSVNGGAGNTFKKHDTSQHLEHIYLF